MKRLVVLGMALILSLMMLSASASGLIPGTIKRNIKLPNNVAENPIIAGESPTTGLPTQNTRYVPILVQIDNNLAAIPQWGISRADIIYEMILTGQGDTRLTALFSDQYPSEVGPVRSGRVMHADLREGWDALIVFFGAQEDPGSNLREALSQYRVNSKGLAADGHANKFNVPGDEYFLRVKYHFAPHNVTAYIQKFHDLMLSSGYQFVPHPFLFSDDLNYTGVSANEVTVVHRGNKDTSSTFIYDPEYKGYQRYTQLGAYMDYLNPAENIYFNNVIIQRSKLSWNNSSTAPLFNEIVGSGAADIFVGGQYVAGAWSRSSIKDRTVFYDQSGNELKLQRGKSWIIVSDEKTDVVINASGTDTSALYVSVSGDEDALIGAEFTNKTTNQIVSTLVVPESDNAPSDNKIESENSSTKATSLTDIPVVVSQPNSDSLDADKDLGNTPVDATTATVIVPNKGPLNMRKSDSKNAELISRIPNGSIVEIIEKGESWTKIEYDGKIGYVMSEYLK